MHQRRQFIWFIFFMILLSMAVMLRAAAIETVSLESKQSKVEENSWVTPQSIGIIEDNSKDNKDKDPIRTGDEQLSKNQTPCVVIDPGHGGIDEGCSGTKSREKDINLAIACMVKELLTEQGYEVVMTREDDAFLSLEERVGLAERAEADVLVSIHQNTYESEQAEGIETWCQEGADEKSKKLSQLIHKYVLDFTEANDREIKYDGDLYITRESSMPSCLIETGFLSGTKEQELLLQEDYQNKIAQGIAAGINLYFNPKTMYLTFDDGPSWENTSKVLDVLANKEVKATFFVVGENVEKNPDIAKRIVEEGHTIAIHCYTHQYDAIYESVDSYLEDFQAAHEIVCEVTGVDTKLFRFPGGSINAYNKDICEDIIEEMTKRGYVYFDWNASLEDAVANQEPDRLLQNAKESTLRRKKVVMLAHDIIYQTTLCLADLIDQFPEYRFEALTKEVAPIQF